MSRRRYAYTLGGVPLAEPLEVSEDFRGEGAERQPVFSDRYMEGVRSPIDGADIGSRTKRRAYMRTHGLVDADDYKGEWTKKAEQRQEFRRTGEDGKDWGRRVQATYNQMQQGRRR
jgi:hypothetical protein